MNKPTIVLVGIGGYGTGYVQQLLNNWDNAEFSLVGAVDPYGQKASSYARLQQLGVPLYTSLEDFYQTNRADLAVISSPIHLHCPQTTLALRQGSHVLCEKPISATIQDALVMQQVQQETGKLVGIGYQWSFSPVIRQLKQDIISGRYGEPRRLKTMVLWPRDKDYYARGWAAKQKDEAGNWILDSVANNATAHYIHNMFYVLGDQADRSASVASVTAELYRANAIENYDTAVIRARTTGDVELLYVGSHAGSMNIGPWFEYEFSEGVIRYQPNATETGIIGYRNDGTQHNYGDPQEQGHRKLWDMLAAIKGETDIACGIEAAMSQTICINAAQECVDDITEFPRELVQIDEQRQAIYVCGLEKSLQSCYTNWQLPSEANVTWAQSGRTLDVTNYTCFPSGSPCCRTTIGQTIE